MHVKWSVTALLQIEEINSFYPENKADMMMDIMAKDIGNILTFPMMGKIEPRTKIHNVRYILSGELRIIYSVHEDHILIVNVYHYKYQYLHVNIDTTNIP